MKFLTTILLSLMISSWALAVDKAPAKEAAPAAPAKTEPAKDKKESRRPTQAEMEALKIDKGANIEISYYDPESDTFELVITTEPGVGPNIATPEELHRATGMNVDFATFSSKKKDYVGSEFQLKEDLVLISEEQVDQRAKERR